MDQSITHDLVPVEDTMRYSMVMPLLGARQAAEAISAYESLKAAIVRPDDVQKIQGRDFLKKSFWRRVATCFGLTLELVSEQRGFDEQNKLFYSVLYKAVAPNGRSMIGDGYCSTAEAGRGGWPEHNVRATAHTRAKNRAISDLVGGGEVSAEEMPDDEPTPTPKRTLQEVKPAPKPYVGIRPDYEGPVEKPVQPPMGKDWQELHDRALDLGFTEAVWRSAVEKYPKREQMKRALDAYEEQHREPEPEQPSQSLDAVDMAAWDRLHIRFSNAGGNMDGWEQLLKESKGDIEDALKFVEQMERTDLRKLPKAAGVH